MNTYADTKSALWRPPHPAFGLLPFFLLRATTEEAANTLHCMETRKRHENERTLKTQNNRIKTKNTQSTEKKYTFCALFKPDINNLESLIAIS